MQKVKKFFRATYKKNITLLKWIFTIAVLLGIVVLPIVSAFLSLS